MAEVSDLSLHYLILLLIFSLRAIQINLVSDILLFC